MRGGSGVLLVAALLLGGSAFAQGKEPRASRTRVSQSGRFGIQLKRWEDGRCRVEVLRESAAHWSLEKCVGEPDDLFFVSEDGERFWVLKTIPQKGTAPKQVKAKKKKKKKAARYPGWTYAVVAAKYDRQGNALEVKRLNDFIRTPIGLGNVRELTRHFKWLEGVAGVPGNPPRLNDEGKVELNTVEPKTFRLDF